MQLISSTDGVFLEWSKKLWETLDSILPLPAGLVPIPEDELLPPQYLISLQSSAEVAIDSVSSPTNSFPCKVKQNQRITAPGHWQDVRHIILESLDPTINYEPGDIAAVWPTNPKEEVDNFLDTLHWTSIADTPLTIATMLTGISCYLLIIGKPLETRLNPPTLRTLATTYLDICSVPRRSFFEILKHFSTDPRHVEKFTEFGTSEGQEELWDYTTRPRRTIVEVLSDFWSSLKIPAEYVLDVFPVMRPRQFSIASSLKVFCRRID
jgi:sulfite reductase alpha subunit-like flavoprotein